MRNIVHVAINAINTPTYFLFPRMAVAMGLATFAHKVVRASPTLARARCMASLASLLTLAAPRCAHVSRGSHLSHALSTSQ